MISEDAKKRIESLSTEDMLYQINLGRKSRFQREKFAYLQVCYQNRLKETELDKQHPGGETWVDKEHDERLKKSPQVVTGHTPDPTTTTPNSKHNPWETFFGKIAIGVIIMIVGTMALWTLTHYFGILF